MITAKTASGAILLLFVVTTLGHAQSLVDLARQEKERRNAIAHTAKVYTNADVKPDTYTPAPQVIPAPATPAPPAVDRPQAPALPTPPVVTQHDARSAPRVPAKHRSVKETAKDDDRHGQWPVIIVTNPVLWFTPFLRVRYETSGVNTIREQAMADYMRAAGFGSGLAPAQSGR